MSLLGTAARTRTLESGTFWCPRERGHRRYQLRSVRRWAQVGHFPLFPVATLGTFLECGSCQAPFAPTALQPRDQRGLEDMLTVALRRAAGRVLGAGSALSTEQQREAVILLQRYASVPYRLVDLDSDIAAASDGESELSSFAGTLNDHAREVVIDIGAQLATAVGDGEPERMDAVREIAGELGIPCANAQTSLDERLQQALDRRLGRAVPLPS